MAEYTIDKIKLPNNDVCTLKDGTLQNATTSVAGLMSTGDKTKLNALKEIKTIVIPPLDDTSTAATNTYPISQITNYAVLQDNFINCVLYDPNMTDPKTSICNGLAAVVYTYGNLVYAKIKNVANMQDAPEGEYHLKVKYLV